MSTLQFLGATETVTGSKYLLEHDGFRMLVDCDALAATLRERPSFDVNCPRYLETVEL